MPDYLSSKEIDELAFAELEAAASSSSYKGRRMHLDRAAVFAAQAEEHRRFEYGMEVRPGFQAARRPASVLADHASSREVVGTEIIRALSDHALVAALEHASGGGDVVRIEMLLAEVARRAGSAFDI